MAQEDGSSTEPRNGETSAGPPHRRGPGKLIGAILLVAAALAAAAYSGWRVHQAEERRTSEALSPSGSLSEEAGVPEPVGAEDAKLRIVVVMGHCFAPVMDQLAEVAAAWPDKVRGEFHAYESAEGSEIVRAHGESLACIFINDENRFTIEVDGEEQRVHFHGPPGEAYRMADVVHVLRVEMAEAYGEVPPDFDEVTKALAASTYGPVEKPDE